MAKAFIGPIECRVTIDKDLGDSWAVAVVPPETAQKRGRPLAPLVVKLQGEDEAKVVKGALEILMQRGDIDRFELDAPPPSPASP